MTEGTSRRAARNVRGSVTAMLMGTSALATTLVAATLLAGGGHPADAPQARTQPAPAHDRAGELKLTPISIDVARLPNLSATFTPVAGDDGGSDGGVAGGCPPLVQTYSGADFTGGQFVLQAGFVETEIAAAEYVVPADDFPLKLDLAEMIFAQQNTIVGTTTEWSLLVWEGNPQTGTLIEVFSSDDLILPHITMPPGTQGVNVQVSVDPGDPEQIIINANPSNSFTIGFRIDKHNDPPTQSCPCPFGTLPAVCCPPATSSNAFPTTDPTGLTNPSKNWLWARACPGASFGCAAPPGWYKFSDLGSFGPSGDWNIRVTYTALSCDISFGACCQTTGCQVMSNFDCAAQNGVYMGANTVCSDVECPFGACCLPQGCQILSAVTCAQQGGTYAGNGITCAGAECPTAGACCFGGAGGSCVDAMTQNDCENDNGTFLGGACADGGCSLLYGACCVPSTGQCADGVDEETCDIVDGLWQGMGSECASLVCFPEGACCLPDGSCIGPVSPEECSDAAGTFHGDGSQCGAVNCPQPTGACCLPNGNCVIATSSNCAAFGGEWKNMGTDCTDSNGSGQADACEVPPCPADLTGDGSVGVPDLLELLAAWGPCPPSCPADLTGDGSVGVPDLLELLAAWGPCD